MIIEQLNIIIYFFLSVYFIGFRNWVKAPVYYNNIRGKKWAQERLLT